MVLLRVRYSLVSSMSRWERRQACELLDAMADRGLLSSAAEREARQLLERGNVRAALQLLTQ